MQFVTWPRVDKTCCICLFINSIIILCLPKLTQSAIKKTNLINRNGATVIVFITQTLPNQPSIAVILVP